MGQQKYLWQIPAVLAVLAVFFTILFYMDNKYETPPPYGALGVIDINGRDFLRSDPIFLIDGWLLTDGRVTDKPTYIGEFSNLQRGDLSVSPHGRACYRLTLRYDGEPVVVSVNFPQLSSWYKIFLNETAIAEGGGNGRITFLMTPGDHVLSVETSSGLGYYSGMYFPPALGTQTMLSKAENVQSFAYALAFLLPLALAVFTLFLWRTGGKPGRFFGMLCCFYALYMFRYFVFLFSMQAAPYWFVIQDAALYGLCFCVVRLAALASGPDNDNAWKRVRWGFFAIPAMLLFLCLLIGLWTWAVFLHGRLTDLYYIFTFCCTVLFTLRGRATKGWENGCTLAGGTVFGAGLVLNLFCSNRFEPIRFFWQFEWCGFWLVLLFGAMMIARSRRILRENDALTNHLEEQVEKRTAEITLLLEERKAFFSDMAHDLKAPVFATQSYIEAIRNSSVGVDAKLSGYLEQVQARQQEMARRLQGLSAINALDKIDEKWEKVPVSELFLELNAIYQREAEVRSVYFEAKPPGQDASLWAQPEKLHILFENLIYNAFRATPCGGHITVSASLGDNILYITVEDTGCGIAEKELPHIFRRFYVGTNNRETGTGLGLYIVQSIVTELGGRIRAISGEGEGTTFVMEFPNYESNMGLDASK